MRVQVDFLSSGFLFKKPQFSPERWECVRNAFLWIWEKFSVLWMEPIYKYSTFLF